jgi:hypothetical protein
VPTILSALSTFSARAATAAIGDIVVTTPADKAAPVPPMNVLLSIALVLVRKYTILLMNLIEIFPR